MGVLDQFKEMFATGSDEPRSYVCRDCQTEFEAPNAHPKDVACSACGSENVASV